MTHGERLIDGLNNLLTAVKGGTLVFQVWFRWENGRKELRYQRPWPSDEADQLKTEVDELHRRAKEGGYDSPYSYKVVPSNAS